MFSASTSSEKACTVQRTLGLRSDLSEYNVLTSCSFLFCYLIIWARWSYGSNRVQIDADIKLLSEFLSYLQADSVRGYAIVSSLAPAYAPSQPSRRCRDILLVPELSPSADYVASLANLSLPLRLLVENEVFRLTVWTNPANDPKRGTDHICALEKTMLDVRDSVRRFNGLSY